MESGGVERRDRNFFFSQDEAQLCTAENNTFGSPFDKIPDYVLKR